MDKIKNAFDKVKEEINELKNSVSDIKKELGEIQLSILTITKAVSTLRQINSTYPTTSTDPSTDNLSFKGFKPLNLRISTGNHGASTDRQTDRQTDTSTDILEKLDSLKKETRLKFKRLTNQEMLVFSAIYQFEDQGQTIDYKLLSQNLNLSESSIRDYIQRMINKKIPVIKEKINNKKIILHISPDLKKLTSLSTLLELREL